MLFDDLSEDEIEMAVAEQGGVLVVGEKAATSDALNVRELEYRRHGRPPIVFDHSATAAEDGQDPIGNRACLASYLGVPPASLTTPDDAVARVVAKWAELAANASWSTGSRRTP